MRKILWLLVLIFVSSCSVEDDNIDEVGNENDVATYKVVYIQSGNLEQGSPVLNMIADNTKMRNVLTNDVIENVLLDSDLERTEYIFESIDKTSKVQIVYANEIDVSEDTSMEISIIIQIFKNDELISEKNTKINSSDRSYSLNETF